MIEYNKEFKKKYPNLAREIEESNFIRLKVEKAENTEDRFKGYNPGVIDFLNRCSTEEEGMEIIKYLEKRGEISSDYALRLRIQLIKYGIRSFGPKREWGYYK
ncbi:DUF2095 family protein [Candidatus Pyrohabitans sp.]